MGLNSTEEIVSKDDGESEHSLPRNDMEEDKPDTASNSAKIIFEEDLPQDQELKTFVTFRERLYNLFHLPKFQVFIVGLVILDCLIVVAELIIDLEIVDNVIDHGSPVPHVLHYISIGILSFFLLELCLKIYAYRWEFFLHKLELFDGVVIVLSFSLDVAFLDSESAVTAVNLLIVLRLWRIARVLNGIVLSVKIQAEHKLTKERKLRHDVEQDLMKCQDYVMNLEEEIKYLRDKLNGLGVLDLPPSAMDQTIKSKN